MYCLVQIGVNTLLPPVGVLSLSTLGLAWAFDDAELHMEQVKGKVRKILTSSVQL